MVASNKKCVKSDQQCAMYSTCMSKITDQCAMSLHIIIITIIIIQSVMRQVPVSQILRHGNFELLLPFRLPSKICVHIFWALIM